MAYLQSAGKMIPLIAETILGRSKTTTIPIEDEGASRQHARITSKDGTWWIEDLHSANGTLVNNRKLVTGPVKLAEGDRITIGVVTLQFFGGQPNAGLAAHPNRLSVGATIGSYTVEALLGDGVATTIYKAGIAGSHVAVHVIDQALVEGDETFAKRFLGDIELAANVRHPSAVRVHRAGAIDKTAWYSTDIVSGDNLAQRLGAPCDRGWSLDIAMSLCELLVPYGDAGLVHGDIKPRSLALEGERGVRLMDLGLIGLNDDERQRAQARGLTRQAYYLCPQQASRGDCNVRSDMYSIGCILVQMLTGRPPFIGADFASIMAAHQREPVPQLAAQLGMPPSFDTVLGDMLHKEQFFRYETMQLALNRLHEVRAALKPSA